MQDLLPAQTAQRLLDSFAEDASQLLLSPTKRTVEGTFVTGLMEAAELDKAHIVVVQAPAGRTALPDNLASLLIATRCGLLVYKQPPHKGGDN